MRACQKTKGRGALSSHPPNFVCYLTCYWTVQYQRLRLRWRATDAVLPHPHALVASPSLAAQQTFVLCQGSTNSSPSLLPSWGPVVRQWLPPLESFTRPFWACYHVCQVQVITWHIASFYRRHVSSIVGFSCQGPYDRIYK